MRYLISTAVILLMAVVPISAANFNLYNGTWLNPAPTPQAVTKLEISIVDSKARVHAFGQLRPKKDYDWGWESASSHSDGHLSVRYRNSSCTRFLTINLSGNTLVVKTRTHFTDNSGRPDRDDTDRLKRSLQPKPQTTPKPMDPVHPKPVTTSPQGKY